MTIFEAAEKYRNVEGLYCISCQHNGRLFGKLGYAGHSDKHAGYSRLAEYTSPVKFLGFFDGHYWDKDVHATLEARGDAKFEKSVYRLNDTEWTEIKSEDDWLRNCELAIQITYDTHDTFYLKTLPDYSLDSLQSSCVKHAVKDLVEAKKHLIHAETGSGKTPMFYATCNELSERLGRSLDIIITTWKPNVIVEFKKYIQGDSKGFLPWKWITANFVWVKSKDEYNELINSGDTRSRVIAISAYRMMYDERRHVKDKKHSWMFRINFDVLGLDEIHYGAWSLPSFADDDNEDDEQFSGKETQAFFKKIKFEYILSLSATPYPNMSFSDFWRDRYSQLTYVQQSMLSRDVKSSKNTKKSDQRYKHFPKRVYRIFVVDPEIFKKQIEQGKSESKIDSFFLDESLKLYAAQMLKKLRVPTIEDDDPTIVNDPVFTGIEIEDKVIFRQNRVRATNCVRSLLEADPFYREYALETGYDRDALETMFNEHRKAMFITTGGNMTGWDRSDLNKLVYTCSPHSPTQLMQDIGRVVRIYKGKETATVIFLAAELSINEIVSTIAKSWCAIKPANETDESWIQKNLKFSEVSLYGKISKTLNWQDFNKSINEQYLSDATNGKFESLIGNIEWLKDNDYLGLKGNKHGGLSFAKSPFKLKASEAKKKTRAQRNIEDEIDEHVELEEKPADEHRLLKISSIIIMYVAKHYTKYKNVVELFKHEDDILKLLKIDKSTFDEMIQNSVFDFEKIQKLVTTGAITKCKLNYEGDYRTVAEQLVPQFEEKIVNLSKESILIVGGGKTLIDLALKLEFKLIVYTAFSTEERYVMDYLFGNTITQVPWELIGRGFKMDFDCVIANPPYSGFDRKIMRACVKTFPISKLVFLAPVRWLQEDYDKEKSNDIFGDHNVEIVDYGRHLWDGFSASAAFDLAIFSINGDKSNYNDVINKKEAFFNTHKNLTWERYHGQKNYVPIKRIVSAHGEWWDNAELYKREWGYIANGKLTDGKRDGLTPTEAWKNETNGKVSNWYGPKLNNAKEAKNFWEYLHLNAFKYYMKKVTMDVNVHLDRLPFPDDFSQPWTEARFYKHFKIAKDEQKLIEETMSKLDE
jgi:hypothetical protein